VITTNGLVVEGLAIEQRAGSQQAALVCRNANNVVLRHLRVIHPATAPGIKFEGCHGIRIENVEVIATGHDGSLSPNPCRLHAPGPDCDSVHGLRSDSVRITNLRATGGSSGVQLAECRNAVLQRIAVHNVRGPYPRGQCVQFSNSDKAVLEDFHCKNELMASWTEDSISAWRSSDVVIRRGLVDGNNSPTGVGINFEGSDSHTHGGLLEQVDAIRMGGGCFSGYPAQGLLMRQVQSVVVDIDRYSQGNECMTRPSITRGLTDNWGTARYLDAAGPVQGQPL
jgi:hypothetical protein